MKKFAMILCIALLSGIVYGTEKDKGNKPKPLVIADKMPSFYGGKDALKKYIDERMEFPAKVQTKGIEGRVVVRFVVTESGEITDPKIIKSIHPDLDKAALEVVKNMPKWKPGKKNGEKVPVYFTLPIAFKQKDYSIKRKGVAAFGSIGSMHP